MPAIIQPGSDMKEFLADGMDTSVPAVQMSDINDGDLLNATRTVDVGNGYKFEITLPSGRVLESAPVGSDYPKRDAIMQWLGAVRESIVEDSANAARAARDADLATPAAPGPSLSPQRAAGGLHQSISDFNSTYQSAVPATDPVEYAKQQLRASLERLAALSSAEAEVEKWQRVVDSLTGGPAKKKKRKKRKVNVS